MLKKFTRLVLFLGLSAVLLYFAFKGIDLKLLMDDIAKADFTWVFLSLIFSFSSLFFRAARWNLLIEAIGYRPGIMNSFYSVSFAYLANFAAPRLGEVGRCAAMNKSEKIPFDALVGTVFLERAIDFLSFVLLAVIVFFLNVEVFGGFITENFLGQSNNAEASGNLNWIIAAAIFVATYLFFKIFHKRLLKYKFYVSVNMFLKGIGKGLRSIFRLKKVGLFFFYTLFMWVCYFLMTYLVVFSLPETAVLKPIDGLFILVVGTFGMTLPAPGGIGAFHYFITLALGIYGIEKSQALAYATITHEAQMLMLIVVGLISTILLYTKNKDLFSFRKK